MAKKTVSNAKSAAKVTARVPAVTLQHTAVQTAEAREMPTKRGAVMLNDAADALSRHLVKGSKLPIVGLGTFQVKRREAPMGRNSRTGERVEIKAGKKVTFRPAKELKEAV